MSIDGLNVFGSLTVNGKKLTLDDFDNIVKNGQVSQAEFTKLLEEVQCDTLEFSMIDTDGDGVITEEEFADFEQKAAIQDTLNELQGTIAKDFTGNIAQYATQCIAELKEFALDFVANYTGTGDIVADFKAALPAKYEEIKNNILENTPEAKAKKAEQEKQDVKSKVLEDLFNQIKQELLATHPELADSIANAIVTKLQIEANKFLANYTGEDLELDLKAHLEAYMTETTAGKLADETENFRATVNSLGGFIDDNELETLKGAAKEILMEVLNQGITFKLNGVTLSSESRIDSALKNYTDAQALIADIEKLINGLSSESIKDFIINEKVAEKQAAEEKAFAALNGTDVQVETQGKINFNNIPGYYDNEKITNISRNNAKKKAVEILEYNLKEQFKAQIRADLKAKGLPEDKLDQIFENVFTQSTWEAAEASISFIFSSFKTKNLVDNFIEIFNKNMASAIDAMNISNSDMDLQDVEWSQAVKDENGEVLPGFETIANAMESGAIVDSGLELPDVNEKQANSMIDRMKPTMLKKAKVMCEANGIEFNNEAFTNIFENAKGAAVAKNTPDFGGTLIEFSMIRPQQLLKDFATNFKTDYTAWVEAEKANAKV